MLQMYVQPSDIFFNTLIWLFLCVRFYIQMIFRATNKLYEMTCQNTREKSIFSKLLSNQFSTLSKSREKRWRFKWHFSPKSAPVIRLLLQMNTLGESIRKWRPHKLTDGRSYAISLTTGQQKSSHALDKGA